MLTELLVYTDHLLAQMETRPQEEHGTDLPIFFKWLTMPWKGVLEQQFLEILMLIY